MWDKGGGDSEKNSEFPRDGHHGSHITTLPFFPSLSFFPPWKDAIPVVCPTVTILPFVPVCARSCKQQFSNHR